MRVAIIDDTREDAEHLLGCLKQYQTEYGVLIQVDTYYASFDFLEEYRSQYDVIFLDIEMPGSDGIEVAHEIRERDESVGIIFVTNMAQYAIKGYEVNAIDFIVKPVGYYVFAEKLEKAIRFFRKRERKNMLFSKDGEIYRISLSEVLYVEKEKSDLLIHTTKGKSKECLLKNKQKIVNIFDEQKYYNIRTLIFSLIAFDKIFDIVDSIEFGEHRYIEQELERVLKYIMISSIRIKSGKAPYYWENSSLKSGIVHYDRKNFLKDRVYGYKFVDDYLLQCRLNKKEIEDTILKIVSEQKLYDESRKLEKSLAYRKLHPWWELEDDEIENILSEILRELKELKYGPRYFKDMIVTLMQMEYNDFKCFEYSDFVDLMAEKIQTYVGEFERHDLEVLGADAEFVKYYNEIVHPLFEIIDKKESKDKKEDNSFLCNQEFWNQEFKKKCQDNREVYIVDNKFFYYIDPDEFITQVQKAKTVHLYNFMAGINTVYDFQNLDEFFKDDIPNLKSILEKIDEKLMCEEKKTKKIALNKLKEKLQESLKLIEKPIYKG